MIRDIKLKSIKPIEIDDVSIIQWDDGDIGILPSEEFIEDHKNLKEVGEHPPYVVVGDENILKLINVLIEAYGYAHQEWSAEYSDEWDE